MGWYKVKELSRNTDRHYTPILLKVRAGVAFPDHRHFDVEEVFVLEGNLRVGSQVLRRGGHSRAEAGTTHRSLFTEEGCLLLVRSSLRDEILAAQG